MQQRKPAHRFDRFAAAAARTSGHAIAFTVALSIVVVWAVTGPLFQFADTWQLVINTGTTVVTFLMVFLIQNTLNRDSIALHLKLDELIRVTEQARDTLIGSERLPVRELEHLEDLELPPDPGDA
jgi:low affinity Fe/Cu permease